MEAQLAEFLLKLLAVWLFMTITFGIVLGVLCWAILSNRPKADLTQFPRPNIKRVL